MNDMEFTATAREIAETIEEFKQYRERLVSETMETAKRAKLTKSAVMAKLEPEIAQIDATIQALQERQAALTNDRSSD
jgi:dsDNA-specific endonuclease/ATPase MutS2